MHLRHIKLFSIVLILYSGFLLVYGLSDTANTHGTNLDNENDYDFGKPIPNNAEDTCSEDKDCNENQKCTEKDGWKSCVCADGLSGTNCEENIWCKDPDKFQNCNGGGNGTCEYNKKDRKVVCNCDEASGRKLHPQELRCRETCDDKNSCKNNGNCDTGFCVCKTGTFGDKCERALDCLPTGKFKGCEESGGECELSGKKFSCKCQKNKKYHPLKEKCEDVETTSTKDITEWTTDYLTEEDCDCGANSKDCVKFKDIRNKIQKRCLCLYGYADNLGYCDECNCGPYGSCYFKYGQKQCNCESFAVEKNGVCVILEPSSSEHTILTSTILPLRTEEPSSEHTTVVTSTNLPLTTEECYCGENSNSCHFNSLGKKLCSCLDGYSEYAGYCHACDCGANSKSCWFNKTGEKRCTCFPGYSENFGYCEAMETTPSQHSTVATSTVLPSTAEDCHCGRFSHSCLVLEGDKLCNCFTGYSQLNGFCTECNCGPYGWCYFKFGQKKCDCKHFAIEKNGVCVVEETIVSDHTTVGTSTISPSTVEDKKDLWMVLLISVAFAIFLLLSGMFCFWTHIFYKISRK